jgi:hypothetical protein
VVDEEFVVNYYIYGYERLLHTTYPQCTRENGGEVIENGTNILDLEGMNFTKILSKRHEIQRFLKMSSTIAQDYYPEIMARLFIINAPLLFSVLWTVVKGFLDEKTTSKIMILSQLR